MTMIRIMFSKDVGEGEPFALTYNNEIMGEEAVNDLVGLIECLYPQSAILTIHENERMVAIWKQRGRQWTFKGNDASFAGGMAQVARIIRGESVLTA